MQLSDFYDIVSRNIGQYTYSLNIPEAIVQRQFNSLIGAWEKRLVIQPIPDSQSYELVPFGKGGSWTLGKIRGAVIITWGVNGQRDHTLTMNLFNGETIKTSNGVKFSFDTTTSKLNVTNVSNTNYNRAGFSVDTLDAESILGIIVTPIDKTLTTYNDIEDISYTCDGQTYNVNVADFSNCNNLEYLSPTVFSNSNHIVTLDGCFANCTSLVTVPTLPVGVKKMYECFKGCTSLVEVPIGNIPNGVEDMSNCFYGCSSLTHAYLPDGVLYIDYCFRGCSLLSTLPSVPSSVISMGGYYEDSSITSPPILPNRVINISHCFDSCLSLSCAPVIPITVKNVEDCFLNCGALKDDIYIYTDSLANVYRCFGGTGQPITLHAMNGNTEICEQLADTTNNNNVFVNVHPETSILFIDTQTNYMTNEGLETLSLQTNANLVQCEIPDLVNGGTITTNVNDALIDLWTRQPLYSPSFTGSKTVNGITIVNNGDGSFTVSGTATAHVRVNLIETRVLCNDGSKYDFSGGMLKTIGLGNSLGTRVITTMYIPTVKQWVNTSIVIGNGGSGEASKSNISMTGTNIPIWKIGVIFNCVEGQTVPLTTFTPKITKAGDV